MKSIAIQGYDGSFHHMAVNRYFGQEANILPCSTFKELIAAVQESVRCTAGLMAIENSIAGSILPNYNLLQQSGLAVAGEVYLEISQNLMVCKGVALADVTEVHSHPMAILQCLDFLAPYSWKMVETEDTALSAKQIKQKGNRNTAVIASAFAADLFGLDILASDIQSAKNNYTRFLLLVKEVDYVRPDKANKASVYFQVENKKGTLAGILQMIAAAGVNLSKLQSFPIPGSQWQYSFHADMEFESVTDFDKVIKDISLATKHLRLYGLYENGINA